MSSSAAPSIIEQSIQQPLLRNSSDDDGDDEAAAVESPPMNIKRSVTTLVLCIYTLDCLAGYMLDVPIVALLEQVACWKYVHQNNLSNPFDGVCKLPEVQREVATIQGLRGTFDAIPAFLMSIYYGRMADMHGRKMVLIMSWTGLILHLTWLVCVCYLKQILPLRAIWLGSLTLFLGGGHKVFAQTAFCVLADVYGSRASGPFMIMSAIKTIMSAVGYPLSGALLSVGVWTPFVAALSMNITCALLVMSIPETRFLKTDSNPSEQAIDMDGIAFKSGTKVTLWARTLRSAGRLATYSLSVARRLFAQKRSRGISIILFLYAVAVSNTLLFPQYASRRLEWPLKSTVILLSVHHVVAAIVTGVALPFFRRRYSTKAFLDNSLLLVVLVIAAAGYSVVGLCGQGEVAVLFAGVVLFAFVEAIEPLALGLAAADSNTHHRGSTFVTLGLLEAVATMFGRPLMTALFSQNIDANDWRRGSCFLLSMVLLLISTVVVPITWDRTGLGSQLPVLQR